MMHFMSFVSTECVCVSVLARMFIGICLYIHTCLCTNIFIYLFTYLCMHAYICVGVKKDEVVYYSIISAMQMAANRLKLHEQGKPSSPLVSSSSSISDKYAGI